MSKDTSYESPEMALMELSPESVVCASPLPGGSEDVGFEDWG